ncbi:MAG: gliding motility-associated C-terminal domain-containing protein, partial [Bacteroidetes bacterium]|nr:gliding motility-associated C-terminal domain-containing protein [Bacteroidota bacterium]
IDCNIHSAQLSASGGISYDWSPSAGLNSPFSPTPIASVDSTTTYIVKGLGSNGCYAFDSVTVIVKAAGANAFVVPNAFTPNGDGHNDCFGVTRWGAVRLEELAVFDRWGERVFATKNPSDCWDGSYRGRPLPTGSYVYIIKAWTFCGEVTRQGIVMLIR